MLFTILIIVAAVALVAFVVMGVQKAKAEKKGIYAETEKCPYHNIKDEETVVGYETAPPAAAIIEKPKKKAAKKAPTKKAPAKKSSTKKK